MNALTVDCHGCGLISSRNRFHIELSAIFNWANRYHGGAEGFWLWVEDNENNRTYHNEYVLFSRRNHPESTTLEVVVPVFDPMPQVNKQIEVSILC